MSKLLTKKRSEKEQFETNTISKPVKTPKFKSFKDKQKFYRLLSRSWWKTTTRKDGTIVKEQMLPQEREGQKKQHGILDKMRMNKESRKVDYSAKKANRKKNKQAKKQRRINRRQSR